MGNLNSGGSCVCEALGELKEFQDMIAESNTKFFGRLLHKTIGTDSIPFLLFNQKGLLMLDGFGINQKKGKKEHVKSQYFLLKEIDKANCRAKISLLKPMIIHDSSENLLCDVIKLEKTGVCIEIDLSGLCAIQLLDIDLLKRKIVIEPK
ncbi:CotY/CotZ family spore coat protein [Mesobacillus harenae]|uniref:CotY/CotZ family spore coat protein n=1 Tax=Mesobacillus harenae TaxID=2213203 RepID=UPI0015811881|nr:CotY/CotZ family spore coat protein [Mesobacillus harenae]